MARETTRDWIRSLERAEPQEQWIMLCFFAGRGVVLDAGEVNAALRRAELLLATGGNPHRSLDLYGRAVTSLASDLDAPEARARLQRGLRALEAEAAGLQGANEALRLLRHDPDLAWQCYACALLAEELAAAGDDEG
jgi:hypothetical protein